jgi:hypothetical protein
MKRITVSIDVSDEHHDQVAAMLESCAKRIVYNYPSIGTVRWLNDSVVTPKIVAMHHKTNTAEEANV